MMGATRIQITVLVLTCCGVVLAACSPLGPDTALPTLAPLSPSPQTGPTEVVSPTPAYTAPVAPTPDLSSPAPQIGDTAPDFILPSVRGGTAALSDYRGVKNVVLLFYRTGG
jgi:hypothetical protein